MSALVRRLARLFSFGGGTDAAKAPDVLNRRSFAEEVDTFRVFLAALRYCRERNGRCEQREGEGEGAQDVASAQIGAWLENEGSYLSKHLAPGSLRPCPKAVSEATYADWKPLVQEHLRSQLKQLLLHVVQSGGHDPYPALPADTDLEHSWLWERVHSVLQGTISRREQQIVAQSFASPLGPFELSVAYSSVDHPEAGFGVQLHGYAAPGTVLGLYPGVVYSPIDVKRQAGDADVAAALRENSYLVSRYDGYVLDGRQWPREALEWRRREHVASFSGLDVDGSNSNNNNNKRDPEAERADGEESESPGSDCPLPPLAVRPFRNQFAVGNYINHPPPGAEPNCIAYAYDFDVEEWDATLLSFVPNRYHREPGLLDLVQGKLRALAIVATAPIEDEEVLLNYRFNPAHPYPEWYEQPDEEEAKRRWSAIRWFS